MRRIINNNFFNFFIIFNKRDRFFNNLDKIVINLIIIINLYKIFK